MSNPIDPKQFLFVLRIIVVAMIVGTTIFAVFAVILGNAFVVDTDLSRYLFPVVLVFAAIGIFSPPFIRRSFIVQARKARQKGAEGDSTGPGVYGFMNAYVIMSTAMIESAALLAVVVYMLTRSWSAMMIAGITVVLMLVRFPTDSMVDNFISSVNRE